MSSEEGTESGESNALMAMMEGDNDRVIVESTVAALAKSEVEAQLDAAHRYRRSISRFMQEATTLATLTTDVAESCIYSLPRGGKPITGPSVRLAEICASAYGNLHVAARIIAVEDKEVVAQGGAWDLEKNLRMTTETRRRITGRDGKRFSDDMIVVTGNAAAAIAKRNAIFNVIPKAYVNTIYEKVKQVAIGKAETLAARRARLMEKLGKMGADQARVLGALGKSGVDDITLEDMETLIGYGTAIKDGGMTVDQCFPPVLKDVPGAAAEEGRRMSLGTKRPVPASKSVKVTDAEGKPIEVPPEEPEPGSNG